MKHLLRVRCWKLLENKQIKIIKKSTAGCALFLLALGIAKGLNKKLEKPNFLLEIFEVVTPIETDAKKDTNNHQHWNNKGSDQYIDLI